MNAYSVLVVANSAFLSKASDIAIILPSHEFIVCAGRQSDTIESVLSYVSPPKISLNNFYFRVSPENMCTSSYCGSRELVRPLATPRLANNPFYDCTVPTEIKSHQTYIGEI